MKKSRVILIFAGIFLAVLTSQSASADRKTRAPVRSAPLRPTPAPTAIPAEILPIEIPSSSRSDFKILPHPQLSGRIAFGAKVDGKDQIFELDFDSKSVRNIIDGPGNNSSPAWSPNGKGLVFVSDRDGNKEIYLSNWDGESLARLTNNPSKDYDPSWAPDGKKIVYSSETFGSFGKNSNIFLLDLKTSTTQKITSFVTGLNSTPAFSPDGTTLAYSTNRSWPGWDICFVTDLKKKEDCPLNGTSSFFRPSWAPKGMTIAYSSGDLLGINIDTYSFADGSISILTDMENREYDATWSPDGAYLAFTAEDKFPETFNIYLMELASKKITPLLQSDHSIRSLSWSKVTTLELEAGRFRRTDGQNGKSKSPAPTK